MITTSNSSVKRSGIPNQLLGVGLHTTACSGLSRVRTELFQLRIIPSLAPHPVQTHRQSAGHGDRLRASLRLEKQPIYESEMALFSECMLQCAQKGLDTADIVKEAC